MIHPKAERNLRGENVMNKKRQLREAERIRAGYYQQHNYTWQYVLQPEEDTSLLSHEVSGKIYPFQPKNDWTDFIRFKYGPAGKDCDSSAAAMLTFELVYDYLQDGEIVPRSDKFGEYQIKKGGAIYCGDTMTSGWGLLKRYFVCLHKALQDRNHELFADFDEWVKVEDKKPVTSLEKDSNRCFKEYCYYFAEQMTSPVGRVLSADCKLFLENVWNQGNMIPVPEFFNVYRASYKYGDTVDRMLTYLYYFIISGDDKYLKFLFCAEGENKKDAKINVEKAEKAAKGWIDKVCDEKNGKEAWNTFVEIHFLQPFCELDENGIYIPVCMFNGKPLCDQFKKPYDKKQPEFLPGNLEECECLFRPCNTAIRERSRLIQQKINR